MRPKGCLRGIGQLLLIIITLGGTVLLGRAAIQGIVDLRTRLDTQHLHDQEILVFPQTATAIGMLQPTVVYERTRWQSPTPQPTQTDDTSMNSTDTSTDTSGTADSNRLSGTAGSTSLPRGVAIATNTPLGRRSATPAATQTVAQVVLQAVTPIAAQAITLAATKNATQAATLAVTQTATKRATQAPTVAATQAAAQVLVVTQPATSTSTVTLTRTATHTAIPSPIPSATPTRTATVVRKATQRPPTASKVPTKTPTMTPTTTPTNTATATESPIPDIAVAAVDLSATIPPPTDNTSSAIVPTLIFAFPTVTDTPVGMESSPRPQGTIDSLALLGGLNTPNPVEIIPPTKSSTPDVPSTVCRDVNARISSPATGSTLRGTVNIIGTANIPDFNYYKLEIRPQRGTTWEPVSQSDTPVLNDLLGTVDTSLILPGYYWIQLTVVNSTGAAVVTPCAILVRLLQP